MKKILLTLLISLLAYSANSQEGQFQDFDSSEEIPLKLIHYKDKYEAIFNNTVQEVFDAAKFDIIIYITEFHRQILIIKWVKRKYLWVTH